MDTIYDAKLLIVDDNAELLALLLLRELQEQLQLQHLCQGLQACQDL